MAFKLKRAMTSTGPTWDCPSGSQTRSGCDWGWREDQRQIKNSHFETELCNIYCSNKLIKMFHNHHVTYFKVCNKNNTLVNISTKQNERHKLFACTYCFLKSQQTWQLNRLLVERYVLLLFFQIPGSRRL